MATGDLNALFKQLRGAVGKQIVIKQYKDKTVITAYPRSSTKKKKKPSAVQSIYQNDFAKAVQYAQAIIYNPTKKKAYAKKVRPGQTEYNYAISEYLSKYGAKKGK